MELVFWGTRGSLPKADGQPQVQQQLLRALELAKSQGIKTIDEYSEFLQQSVNLGTPIWSYGGHTSCTEIRTPNQTSCFVDMGSGLKDAGTRAIKSGEKSFHVFLTHMHWDHIMGLPFFVPIYTPGHKIKIYHVHKSAPEYIRILFNGSNFPVKWDELKAEIEFVQLKLYQAFQLNDLQITPFALDHPGGCFGYHFATAKHKIAIGVDGEYKRRTREDLGKDLPFLQNLDLFVFDSQYELDELADRFDWGHCSPSIGVDISLREQIKHLVLTHHDPWSDYQRLDRMHNDAKRHLKKSVEKLKESGVPEPAIIPKITMAYDGLRIPLT